MGEAPVVAESRRAALACSGGKRCDPLRTGSLCQTSRLATAAAQAIGIGRVGAGMKERPARSVE